MISTEGHGVTARTGVIARRTSMTTSAVFVVAFVAAASVLLPAGYTHPNIYDEGLVVTGAMRVLDGDVPYRDFWTIYPPGIFMLIAGVFKLFGPSLVIERTVSALVNATLVSAGAAAAMRGGAGIWAAWSAALILMCLRAGGFHASAPVSSLTLLVVAMLLAAPSDAAPSRRRLLLAGVVTAIAAAFRHDFGAYGFLAIVGALVMMRVTSREGDRARGAAAWYAGSALASAGAIAAALVLAAGTVPVIDQLVTFPMATFPRYRDLPYPAWSLAIGPPLLGICGLISASSQMRAGRTPAGAITAMISFAGLLLIAQSAIRSDFTHVFPAFAMSVIGFAIACAWTWRQSSRPVRAALLIGASLATVQTVMVLPPAQAPATYTFTLARARGMAAPPDAAEYEAAIRRVQELTGPGDRIFAGNDRHDRIFINDALFYFLAARRSGTRYHELHPGVATTEAVQQRIIDELLANRVAVVVIRTERHPLEAGNASSRSSGVTRLDDFLRREFTVSERFGDYEVRRSY